jgi:hypothetical protein
MVAFPERTLMQPRGRQPAEAAVHFDGAERKEWLSSNSQRRHHHHLTSSEAAEAKIERSTTYTTPRYKESVTKFVHPHLNSR